MGTTKSPSSHITFYIYSLFYVTHPGIEHPVCVLLLAPDPRCRARVPAPPGPRASWPRPWRGAAAHHDGDDDHGQEQDLRQHRQDDKQDVEELFLIKQYWYYITRNHWNISDTETYLVTTFVAFFEYISVFFINCQFFVFNCDILQWTSTRF